MSPVPKHVNGARDGARSQRHHSASTSRRPYGWYGRAVTVPRWLWRIVWAAHRALGRITGGRVGTIGASATRLGTLYLLTTGRTTGRVRRNGLYYLPEGDAFVVVASNVGADQDPAWWRNLQAQPEAIVELGGRTYPVLARQVLGEERDRLYARFEAVSGQFTTYREGTARTIPVIELAPRAEAGRA